MDFFFLFPIVIGIASESAMTDLDNIDREGEVVVMSEFYGALRRKEMGDGQVIDFQFKNN